MTLSDIESKNIDAEKLNCLLRSTVDELERRCLNDEDGTIDEKTKLVVAVCMKLWEEKEGWKQMYYELYKRYDQHLDKEMETLKKMLPRSLH